MRASGRSRCSRSRWSSACTLRPARRRRTLHSIGERTCSCSPMQWPPRGEGVAAAERTVAAGAAWLGGSQQVALRSRRSPCRARTASTGHRIPALHRCTPHSRPRSRRCLSRGTCSPGVPADAAAGRSAAATEVEEKVEGDAAEATEATEVVEVKTAAAAACARAACASGGYASGGYASGGYARGPTFLSGALLGRSCEQPAQWMPGLRPGCWRAATAAAAASAACACAACACAGNGHGRSTVLGENLVGRACEQPAPRWIAMAGGRAAGASAVCAEMVDTAGVVVEKAAEAAKVVAQATAVAVTTAAVGMVDETTEVLAAARSRSGGRSRSNHHRARSCRTRRPDHRRRTSHRCPMS